MMAGNDLPVGASIRVTLTRQLVKRKNASTAITNSTASIKTQVDQRESKRGGGGGSNGKVSGIAPPAAGVATKVPHAVANASTSG